MDSITITRTQFMEAVKSANDYWGGVGEEAGFDDPMKNLLMSLQNLTFGTLLCEKLFENNEN